MYCNGHHQFLIQFSAGINPEMFQSVLEGVHGETDE